MSLLCILVSAIERLARIVHTVFATWNIYPWCYGLFAGRTCAEGLRWVSLSSPSTRMEVGFVLPKIVLLLRRYKICTVTDRLWVVDYIGVDLDL